MSVAGERDVLFLLQAGVVFKQCTNSVLKYTQAPTATFIYVTSNNLRLVKCVSC